MGLWRFYLLFFSLDRLVTKNQILNTKCQSRFFDVVSNRKAKRKRFFPGATSLLKGATFIDFLSLKNFLRIFNFLFLWLCIKVSNFLLFKRGSFQIMITTSASADIWCLLILVFSHRPSQWKEHLSLFFFCFCLDWVLCQWWQCLFLSRRWRWSSFCQETGWSGNWGRFRPFSSRAWCWKSTTKT